MSIITIDAIGTQTEIAQTIVEAEADYVLSVKENQGHLYEDISVLFAIDQAHDFKYASFEHAETTNKDHTCTCAAGASVVALKSVSVGALPTLST